MLKAGILAVALSTQPILATFDPLHHVGGNGPWFAGPNVFDIDPEPPVGCVVDQVAFVSRHGSRYPDPGAYDGWTALSAKIAAANFTTNSSELTFLKTWQPVLRHPELELSQLSLGGYKELYAMGVDYRYRYPDLYIENAPFALWANWYNRYVFRVVDSARLFARGYLGPNATDVGTVYVVNASDTRAVANSLAPGDLCPNYEDSGGGENATIWADTYLPPIAERINTLLHGLEFTASDVSNFPYLCGFETQITGRRSPWCDVFTEDEILAYEYAQDIRYWYGTGLGTDLEKNMMLPFLTALVQRFVDGPHASYPSAAGNGTFKPNPLIAAFTNDGQINQLAAAIGVFDDQPDLSASQILQSRTFHASNFDTMRGTISFERLSCGVKAGEEGTFLRLKLNDAVYPVVGCDQGPGRSCELGAYRAIVERKREAFGDFGVACGIGNNSVAGGRTTFLTNPDLPFVYTVKP